MPRPISWLPRLHEITRSVTNSVRSHYDRRNLEQLFELQPRAAQKLLELLPSVQVGTSRLIERQVLLDFLERVRDADDTTALLATIRTEKNQVSHRRLRSLVRRDRDPAPLSSLPSSIRMERGRMEVRFGTVEELAEAMFALAQILDTDMEAFTRSFEPHRPPPEDFSREVGDVRGMFDELEALEAARGHII